MFAVDWLVSLCLLVLCGLWFVVVFGGLMLVFSVWLIVLPWLGVVMFHISLLF